MEPTRNSDSNRCCSSATRKVIPLVMTAEFCFRVAGCLWSRITERIPTSTFREEKMLKPTTARRRIGSALRPAVAVLAVTSLGLMYGQAGGYTRPAQQRSLELADYYRLESAENPALSPDG